MVGATLGSSRASRLDPRSLPASASITSGRAAGTVFTIDGEAATLSRPAHGSRATRVPLTAYRGVAVRMEGGNAGAVRVFVELLHSEPALTLPLIVADDPTDAAADWQAWGRALKLPLLVVAADGTVSQPLSSLGALTVFPAKPRRRHAFFAERRPRFLARRKPGRRGSLERLSGREIIART
jgi:hypothetical protein